MPPDTIDPASHNRGRITTRLDCALRGGKCLTFSFIKTRTTRLYQEDSSGVPLPLAYVSTTDEVAEPHDYSPVRTGSATIPSSAQICCLSSTVASSGFFLSRRITASATVILQVVPQAHANNLLLNQGKSYPGRKERQPHTGGCGLIGNPVEWPEVAEAVSPSPGRTAGRLSQGGDPGYLMGLQLRFSAVDSVDSPHLQSPVLFELTF